MDQLSEEHIIYDMREDLGNTDLKESMVRSDYDNAVDAANAPAQESAGTKYLYDDGEYDEAAGMDWGNNPGANGWANYYVIFKNMAPDSALQAALCTLNLIRAFPAGSLHDLDFYVTLDNPYMP